jgi:hypothetical protein
MIQIKQPVLDKKLPLPEGTLSNIIYSQMSQFQKSLVPNRYRYRYRNRYREYLSIPIPISIPMAK